VFARVTLPTGCRFLNQNRVGLTTGIFSQLRIVPTDYLVAFDANRYSVPFTLVGQTVDVRRRHGHVEISHRGRVVACHPELTGRYQIAILPEHGPGAIARNARRRYATPPVASLPVTMPAVEIRDLASQGGDRWAALGCSMIEPQQGQAARRGRGGALRLVEVAAAVFVLVGSAASAQDLAAGITTGAAVPVGGIGYLQEPALSLSAWLTDPIRGAVGWRAEVGVVRLNLPLRDRFRCAAVGLYCDADVPVGFVVGGFQLGPRPGGVWAPYGYLTAGLYHVTANAEVVDLREGSPQPSVAWSDNAFGVAAGAGVRVALGGRWTVRAELRYSGFAWRPETQHWASLVTPAVSLSASF